MTTSPLSRPIRSLLLAAALVIAPVSTVLAGSGPVAAASPAAVGASAWLAGLVGPDGGVENPYAPGSVSAGWTVNVALSLAATGTEPEALDAAMGYLAGHVDDYVVRSGVDNAGALGYLILLVVATDGDPASFGTPVHRPRGSALGDARHDRARSLRRRRPLLGRHQPGPGAAGPHRGGGARAGRGPPVARRPAVRRRHDPWRRGGRLAGLPGTDRRWARGVRQPRSGLRSPAPTPTPPRSPSRRWSPSARATPVPGALEFLRTAQAASGPYAGGFTSYPSGDPDPNSTALVLQALTAAGEDLGAWARSGQTPLASLEAWVVAAGPDAGALASPFSAGGADPFATYQGVWGLALQPFPFRDIVVPVAPVVPVVPDVPGETVAPMPEPSPAPAQAVVVVAAFTG